MARLVLWVLVPCELVLALVFIGGVLTDRGNNFLLGTILGAEFLLLALAMICYISAALPFREIVEDRDEGLLW